MDRRVRFADIVVDVAGMRVTRAGAPVALEPKAFDLLVHLIRERGRLVDKEELVRVVWHGVAVTDNAITRSVAQLRRGLGDEARQPQYIETVPTRGYRFIAQVEAVPEEDVGGAARETGSGAARAASPARRAWPGGRWVLAAAASIVAAALVAGAWAVSRRASAGPRVAAAAVGLPFTAGSPTQITVSTGLDHFPSASPDGTAVAYASDRPGRFEIAVKALAPGGGERWVTNDGRQNVQPAWSPDGRHLAYHARVPGGVWIVPALGGAPRQLAETGSAPAWSPDGRWIAFQTAPLTDLGPSAGVAFPPSVIALVNPETGEQRRLTRPGVPEGGHGPPVWTPDGARVVFALSGRYELWSVTAAGGEPQRLVACGSACLDPFFGPDGALYFTQGFLPRIVRVPIDPLTGLASGEPHPIAVPVGGTIRHVSVSANGRLAAFAVVGIRSNLATVTLDAEGRPGGAPVLLTNDTSRRNTYPAFSPDGSRIAYTSGRAGRGPDIWVIDAAGGSEPEPVTLDPGSEGSPQWLSGSREILFKSYRNGRLMLSAVDVDTRRERVVFAFDPDRVPQNVPHAVLEAFTLRLAPDAKTLAFAASIRGVPNVFVADPEMRSIRQITRDAEGATFPVIAPGGDRVAVQAARHGDTRLAIVPMAGGPVEALASSPGQTWIHSWSPDGRYVAAATMRGGVWNVTAIDAATGREHPLTRYTEARMFVRYPDWSPLGDRLAFEHAEVTGNIWITELSALRSTSTAIW